MRVVQINTVYQFGSTGRILCDLEEAMRRNNISPYAIYGRDMTGEIFGSDVYKMSDKCSWYINKFTTHLLGYEGYSSKKQTQKAINFIERIDPEIVHLHNLHGYYLNLEELFEYLQKTNKKVVWTFHDCWPFTGHCAYFHQIGCERWKNGCGNCPQKISYPRSMIFDRSERQWQDKRKWFTSLPNLHIVTVSNWLKSLVEESFLGDCDIRTIYNGVNTSVFLPQESGKLIKNKLGLDTTKKLVLGVASGWTERKGLADFMYFAEKAPADVVFLLVGQIPSGVKIPDNIIHYGRTNNLAQLAELYSAADIFVNPSKQETFGLTTAEAMACGTPAIVYDTTACPEVVGSDTRCGDIVPAMDKQAMLECILNRLSMPKDEVATRQWVVNNFDKEIRLDDYVKLYKED